MAIKVNVSDTISIRDSSEDGKVQIGVGQCKDPSLVSIYIA
jgi:hypothetical protein